MTKSQFRSLQRFDDEWRTLAVLRHRGVDGADLLALIKLGFVEVRSCGEEFYRITAAGWRELRKQGAAVE